VRELAAFSELRQWDHARDAEWGRAVREGISMEPIQAPKFEEE
jgi:hypothetical protein